MIACLNDKSEIACECVHQQWGGEAQNLVSGKGHTIKIVEALWKRVLLNGKILLGFSVLVL